MLKQKTVYFREEDLPLWEAISNKAEWLHEKLAGASGPSGLGGAQVKVADDRPHAIKQQPATLQEQATAIFAGKCPGHTMRMNCGLKGCKYT